MDMHALRVEVTQAQEAARVAAILATETSDQEAAMTRASAMARVKDAEDRATLAEREAQERVSRVEAKNIMVIVSCWCFLHWQDT
jgi:hypothetical protein